MALIRHAWFANCLAINQNYFRDARVELRDFVRSMLNDHTASSGASMMTSCLDRNGAASGDDHRGSDLPTENNRTVNRYVAAGPSLAAFLLAADVAQQRLVTPEKSDLTFSTESSCFWGGRGGGDRICAKSTRNPDMRERFNLRIAVRVRLLRLRRSL